MQIKQGKPYRLDQGDRIKTPAWPDCTVGQVIAAERDEIMVAFGTRLEPMQLRRRRGDLHLISRTGYDFGVIEPAKGTLSRPVERLTRRKPSGTFDKPMQHGRAP